MKRSEAREWAFKLIFESLFHQDLTSEDILKSALAIEGFEADKYIVSVFEGVLSARDELDSTVSKYAKGWSSERISKVSLSILRLSLYEMRYVDDVPMSVSINEAVELAKKYDTDNAPAFINGILNSIAKAENIS